MGEGERVGEERGAGESPPRRKTEMEIKPTAPKKSFTFPTHPPGPGGTCFPGMAVTLTAASPPAIRTKHSSHTSRSVTAVNASAGPLDAAARCDLACGVVMMGRSVGGGGQSLRLGLDWKKNGGGEVGRECGGGRGTGRTAAEGRFDELIKMVAGEGGGVSIGFVSLRTGRGCVAGTDGLGMGTMWCRGKGRRGGGGNARVVMGQADEMDGREGVEVEGRLRQPGRGDAGPEMDVVAGVEEVLDTGAGSGCVPSRPAKHRRKGADERKRNAIPDPS